MSRFVPKLPSPALVVAIIALVLALAGTSYAAFTVGTKNIKNSAVTTRKLRDGAVTTAKLAPGAVTATKINPAGLTVPSAQHATTADSASTATEATNATNATNAANAQPLAFARVSAAGAIDAADSKNVGSASLNGTSKYCLSGIPFTVRGGQATVDEEDSGYEYAQFALGTVSGCPAGTQAFVFTASGGSPAAAGFFVELYG